MTDALVARAGTRWPAATLGAAAGASLWLSSGVLAVTAAEGVRRVGALPSWPWLLAGLAVGAAVVLALRLTRAQAAPLALLALLWLPWLPVRVPAAFLLWEGPLEALVWLGALGGVAWAAWPWRRIGLPPARAVPVAFGVALTAYLAGAWVLAGVAPAGDEPHYLVITQSLLADGDLRIENNHRQGDYTAYFDGELKPDYLQRGTDGQIYSIHAPGLPALVLPAFALFGHTGVVVLLAAIAAGGTAAAWAAGFRLTGSVAAAWAGWAGIAFSTPVFFHAFAVYPDATGGVIATLGVLALVAMDTGARLRPVVLAGLGTLLALLPWLHTRFSLLAAAIGVAVLLRLLRAPGAVGRVAAFLCIPVVSAGLWLWSFYVLYGRLDPTAPYGGDTQTRLSHLLPGVPGLLFDQQFGLVANAPVYAAAALGLVAVWRRSRRLTIELLALVVPYVLAVASYRMWWGGYSAPGRFAVAVLLPMAVPLAAGWAAWPSLAFRGATVVLVALSVAITFARGFLHEGQLLRNDRNGADLLLDAASRSANLPFAMPSLHRELPAEAAADVVAWLVVGALALGVLHLLGRRPASRGATWLRTSMVGAIAVMLAASVVWARHPDLAVTPSTSQMSFLERWSPARRPLVVQVDRPRRVPAAEVVQRFRLASTIRGVRTRGEQPLLQIPHVPAGEYDVFIEGQARLEGTVVVTVGRTDQPLERWDLSGRAGFTGLTLRLPTMDHSVTMRGDEAARRSVRALSLRPRTISTSEDRHEVAVRAAAYGQAALFFLDDNVWVEPGGVWLRGRATARVAVQPGHGVADGSTLVLMLRAGPVANRVTLAAGAWRMEVRLQPGETRAVPLPPEALAPAVVDVTSETGFRLAEVDPASGDVRMLGVWMEPR